MTANLNELDFQGISFQIPEDIRPHITQSDVDFVLGEILREHKKEHISFVRMFIEDEELGFGVKTIPFNRIRRITGYLTGDATTWNDAKRKELEERVKHTTGGKK